MILNTFYGFFGTARTVNLERFYFHQRCSQNRFCPIFFNLFSNRRFIFRKNTYWTALVASPVGCPPAIPHENRNDAVYPALSTVLTTDCQILQNLNRHLTLALAAVTSTRNPCFRKINPSCDDCFLQLYELREPLRSPLKLRAAPSSLEHAPSAPTHL